MATLPTKLLLIVLTALLPTLAFQIYSETQARAVRQQLTQEEGLRLLRMVRAEQQRIVEGAEQVLSVIANAPPVRSLERESCQSLLANLLQDQMRYLYADVTTRDGTPFCTPGLTDRKFNPSDRVWFKRALETEGFVVGDYAIGRYSGVRSIHMARPFRDDTGKIAGVVEVALSLKWLNEQVAKLDLPAGSVVSISDRNGVFLARYPGGLEFAGHSQPADRAFLMEGTRIRTFHHMTALDTGRPKFVTVSPPGADPNGLMVAVSLDEDASFAPMAQADRLGLELIVAGALLAFVLTSLMGHRLIRHPVAQLIDAADQWRGGALGVRTALAYRRDEFGRLANAFDDMAETLEARERELRESEALFRAAFEQAAVGMIVADTGQTLLRVNDKLCEMTGYARDELIGLDSNDLSYPGDREAGRQRKAELLAGKRDSIVTTKRWLRKDGSIIWVNLIGSVLHATDHQPVRMFAVAEDVTERERTEAALQKSEESLRLSMAAARLGVRELDLVTNQARWSPEAARILGMNYPGDASFETWITNVHPDDRERVQAEWQYAVSDPEHYYEAEYRYRQPDGSWRWIASYGRAMFQAGRPVRGMIVIRDISNRKRTEQALSDSEARLRMSQEAGRIGSWDWNLVTNTGHWSELQCRQFGFDPALRDNVPFEAWSRAVHPDDLGRIMAQRANDLTTGGKSEIDYRVIVSGQVRWINSRSTTHFDDAGKPVRRTGIDMDITERRALEEELRALTADLESRVQEEVAAREAALARAAHAERMQALGQLAGGIAHDINNVLQAVAGALAMIQRRTDDATALARYLRLGTESIARGAAITGRLLAFGRRADLSFEPVHVATLLNGLCEILTHTLGVGIEVVVALPADLPPVLVDKGQLETVLVNLATNARDAMQNGGRLTFSAATECVNGPHHAGLSPGAFVRLDVADTGMGMDAATLLRAREPFFTTKKSGAGTGLGLPMAMRFAEQSGGAMTIESQPGAGTTIRLWLPRAGAEPATGDRPHAPSVRTVAPARILVVDDEDMIREMVADSLTDAGYAVLVASSGTEALGLLSAGEAVDLLLTDLSMPGMDGLTLIRAAQDRFPHMPALLLTGHAGDTAYTALGDAVVGRVGLLRKPVTDVQLLERVDAMLARPMADAGGGE